MSDTASLTDGSHLVAKGALHAGVDFFVGYPITPASGIYTEMIRSGVGISGGFVVPVLCPSSVEECAEMTVHPVNVSEQLRKNR